MSSNNTVRPRLHYAVTSSTIDSNFVADTIGFSKDELGFWVLHGELPLSYGGEKTDKELMSPRTNDYVGALSTAISKYYNPVDSLQEITKEALLDVSLRPHFVSSKHGASISFGRYSEDGTKLDWLVLGNCYITVKNSSGWVTHRDRRFNKAASTSRCNFIKGTFLEEEQYKELDVFSQSRRAYLTDHRKHRGSYPEPYYTLAAEIIANAEDPEKVADHILSSRTLSGTYKVNSEEVIKRGSINNSSTILVNGNIFSDRFIDGKVLLWSGSTYDAIERITDGHVRSDTITSLMEGSVQKQIGNIDRDMRYKFGFSDAMALLRAEIEKTE